MPNKILHINDYSISSSDVFFFDNNIWMFLLCPIAQYGIKKQQAYSKFFEYILQRQRPIFTNSLVLSEFSNRYLRLDFDIERDKPENAAIYKNYKKDYIGSAHGNATIKVVKTQLSKITKLCERCSDDFNSINLDEVFNLFTVNGFNDSYYMHQASKKNWVIVSDDSDFSNGRIPDMNLTILTYKN